MQSLRDQLLEALREVLRVDGETLAAILNYRLAAKPELEQLVTPFVTGGHEGRPTLGPLGIVNGVLALAGERPITAHYRENGQIDRLE